MSVYIYISADNVLYEYFLNIIFIKSKGSSRRKILYIRISSLKTHENS